MSNPVLSLIKRHLVKIFGSWNGINGFIFFPMSVVVLIIFDINSLVNFHDKTSYLLFLIPGLLCMQVINRSASLALRHLKDGKRFLKLLLAQPIGGTELVLGLTLGELIVQIINIGFMFALLLSLGVKITLVKALISIFAISFLSAGFLALSAAITLKFNNIDSINTVYMMILYSISATGNVFIPVEKLPLIAQWIAYANPVTYATDILRHTLLEAGKNNIFLDMIALTLFLALTLCLAIFTAKKKSGIE